MFDVLRSACRLPLYFLSILIPHRGVVSDHRPFTLFKHPEKDSYLLHQSMQLLSLLPLASLAVAAPFGKRSSCLAQQWNIQQFEVFLAGNTSTTASHLSFYFDDPNFGIRAECSRGMKLGATPMNGPGSFADFNWYPCAGGATYRLEGLEKKEGFVTIKRTGVECGK